VLVGVKTAIRFFVPCVMITIAAASVILVLRNGCSWYKVWQSTRGLYVRVSSDRDVRCLMFVAACASRAGGACSSTTFITSPCSSDTSTVAANPLTRHGGGLMLHYTRSSLSCHVLQIARRAVYRNKQANMCNKLTIVMAMSLRLVWLLPLW
jgi:hypothetical protein